MQVYMQGLYVKKKVVPDKCCQGGVSPFQGMLYNIIRVPPSASANQMRRYYIYIYNLRLLLSIRVLVSKLNISSYKCD